MAAGNKVTIYDISREAGVSTATISRVINDSPKVDFTTRQRVKALFKKHNFRPRVHKSKAPHIGIILQGASQTKGSMNDYLAGIYSGCSEYTREHQAGLSTVILNPGDLRHPKDVMELLLSKEITAAVFENPPVNAEYVYALSEIDFPYTTIGSSFDRREINTINVDNRHGIESAVRHLHQLGHRRIGFLTVDSAQHDARERLAAFDDMIEQLGFSKDENPSLVICSSDPDYFQLGYRFIIDRLAAKDTFPQALVCLNDTLALGAMRAFIESGFRIPNDISIIGFDDYRYSRYLAPALTTVRSPIHEVGYYACEFLESRIKGNAMPAHRMFPTELIVRESCSAPGCEV